MSAIAARRAGALAPPEEGKHDTGDIVRIDDEGSHDRRAGEALG
jgi:hypothetical protein